ncbi:MAG: hypothetical protein HY606_14385 [Planctomycetes bacterium]|nr:hypothetical protein [Planctomycetota bacterium]
MKKEPDSLVAAIVGYAKPKNSEGTSWEQHDKLLFTRLDTMISIMPLHERGNLTRRVSNIIPSNAPEWKEEYDKQFWEVLVEILGYGWLHDKFPSHRVQFEEPPDIVVRDDKCELVAAMACKKIRTSDANDQFFERQRKTGEVVGRDVDTRVLSSSPTENPFLRKLKDTLSQAERQLNQVDSPTKFIFLSISWDVSAAISRYKPCVIGLITKEASNLSSGITLIAFEELNADQPFVGG